jgi:fructose-1,6-bisphosphatase II
MEAGIMDILPTRNLALELVRVTEAAALSAGRLVGRGDKIAADKAAVDAMRLVLNTIQMNGHIVIGEGEKDEAPMLFNGENVGSGGQPEVDIAVDPIDGTRLVALGLSNAIATIALAPCGTLFNPGPVVYMHKIAVGPQAREVIDIEAPVADNLKRVARAKGMEINNLTVVILDRVRHENLVHEVRLTGARILMIPDGDVSGAIMTAWPESQIDVLLGVGGTPEGVLAACALRCMGGSIQGKLYARDEKERRLGEEMGYDFDQVVTMDDLVSSDDIFFAATGITDGQLLQGVRYSANNAHTDSLVMRGLTGTVRQIIATHSLAKLARISPIEY